MSVTLRDGSIVLVGTCDVGEAETLVGLIQGHPNAVVELSEAGAVHTALWQVLLALSPAVAGEPSDPFVQRWIVPQLAGKSRSVPT